MIEFSLGAMRSELKQALKKYNEYRPHQGLQGLTPMAYIQQTTSAALSQNA
jgi:transposase InsO family protein